MAVFEWSELREYAPRFLVSSGPDRDLGIFESLNDSFSLRWGFMIAGYVSLVPNSVKRSALVACLIALIPIAIVLAFCRQYPVSWGFTAGLAFDSFLWSAAFAGVSLYALQIIDTTLRGKRVLGHYTLLEKIGEGGMGAVWKARHRSYVQFVALKFPSDQFVRDRTAMKRFRAEVEAMAAMNHPHLVRVYNFDPGSEGRPYFVMELLDGWTLDSIVRQHGPLPASRAVYLVRQVCAALAEIHARGMVHRDVKPSNIMLCNYHTEFDFVKLLDLGVVHFPGAPRANPLHSIAGTPSYMSPELFMPSKTLDGRSDLFSVGAVLFFLVTGEALVNETVVDLNPADGRKNRPPLHSLSDAKCPPGPSEIVEKCTRKNPDERYQSAEQLIAALDELRLECQWNNQLAGEWWLSHLHKNAEAKRALLQVSPHHDRAGAQGVR
jgi:serine/threonine-protein kinase